MFVLYRTPTNRKNANTTNTRARYQRFNLVYTKVHIIVIFHILSRLIGSHVACYSCRLYLVFPSTVPQLLLQLAIVSYAAHDTTTFLQAENHAIEIALSRRIQKHASTEV